MSPAEFLHDISRLVCRKWRRIIHSDAFANRKIQHSAYGLLINCKPTVFFSHETTYDLSEVRTTIIGSCNGLALELNDYYVDVYGQTLKYSMHVMNPLSKKSFLLPPFSVRNKTVVHHVGYGIGYSSASRKYKVTLLYKYTRNDRFIYLAILTVGVNKSWRHVELPGLQGDRRRELLVCSALTSEGFLHWGRRGDCLTLNVETETFTTCATPTIFNQPCSSYYYGYYYLSTGRYLSLLVGRAEEFSWDVWEMQSGGGGEWRKLKYKIDLEAQKEKLQQFATGYDGKHLLPVGWVKYPKILVFGVAGTGLKWRHCIFYNLETHEIKTIELNYNDGKRGGGYKAFVHRNNLVHLV